MEDIDLKPELELSVLNPNPKRVPGPLLLHQLVKSKSHTTLPAIYHLDHHGQESFLSYSQLHHAADNLASRISRSVEKAPTLEDFVVPLLVPQSPHLYIAILAILKAGGAFCPLNLDAPPERVRFILQDVSAKVVIVSRDMVSKIPADEPDRVILLVDEDEVEESTPSSYDSFRNPEPHSLAYVMYTSGSTGTPKGVGVSHDAAAQSLLAHNRHLPQFNRFLQFASPTFDVSVFEIFFPLLRGSTLVTCDRGRMLNDLPAVIRTLQVDACELTPTVAGSLLRSRENAPCLKLLLTIGEMLTESVIREFGGNEESEGILWGMYGPTEAAIHCTVRPKYPRQCAPSNIGFPLDSVSCFVASIPQEGSAYEFRILPLGEPGELVVGGHQLANGYLNRPEQTQAAFFDTTYGRVYRTGDKAIMNHDGTLECLGRISDGQVKLRGQRIELGEVEQAAMRTGGCHSAIAMVLGGILVAFCAVDDTSSIRDQAEGIINTCRAWLPSFMVPGDVVVKTSFPRLPSGKVDRKQLRSEYETAAMSQSVAYTEPADPMEQKVAEIVFKSLGIRVTASTQLASSGVDSLRAIRLASALRDGGFEASATDILGSKTLSALCTILRSASKPRRDETGSRNNATDPSEIPLDRLLGWRADLSPVLREVERVQWCTPLQSSMLAETSINPQAYCNWIKLEFPSNTTTQDVENWTHQMAASNEILRSGFVSLNSGFAQVVFQRLPHTAVQTVKDFSHDFCLASDEDFLHPFSAQVCEGNSEIGPTLLLQVHHSQYDGWSADMLTEDYSALLASRSPETRPQFRDVARFYADPIIKNDMDEARGFWADHLLGWQRHNLPRLMGRPVERPQTQTVSRRLDIPQSALNEAISQFNCHPQVFFQASLLWLWAGLQGQNDVVIGSVSSGRTIPVASVERIMGPCIATTPLRVDLARLTTIADLVRDIHSKNRQVLQHGILPLSDIKKIAGVNPGDALFDMLFVYQESLYSQPQRDGQVKVVSHQDFLETNFLVEIEPSSDGPTCRLTYRTSAISTQHINMLMEQLGSVVLHLIRQPENPITSVGKALPSEMTSIFNANPSTLSAVPDLAATFEQSAHITPDAAAISFANSLRQEAVETISFSNLNSLSNRIARYLQEKGAKERDVVGLVMEKSISLYAVILGILKAGCAYLPLLPTTPAERIRVILAQAGVKLCVADAKLPTTLNGLSNSKFVDIQSIDMSSFADANLCLPPDPSRPAYVIYTSGTTGTPKGVVVTHANIVSNLDVLSKLYPHSNRSRLLQACSQAFDVSVFEIFFTWKVGACLCSGTNDTLFEDLERAIRFLECTHLSMTPTVASLVDPRNVPTVEFLVTAGEPMTTVVAEKWTGYLFQGYGPAETTNICTVKKMKSGDFIDHLGFSFENTSTFVLGSATTDVVPIGCVGELCFGGDQVAAGYLGMPELTNAKFVNHPHFGRIYRSGDMGRMLPDGSLMVLGRMDDQLKLRGQRIDTGEISSILTTSGLATSSAVVIVSRANSSASQLAVFYVPVDRIQPNHETLPIDEKLSEANNILFGLLRSRLPAYMVPSYLVPISSVPLTSSGKVDRAELQSSFREFDRQYLDCAAGTLPQNADDASWSENEKTIRTALSEVLNVPIEDITRWQPFAAVGLDSISAISLARGIQRVLQQRVPVSLVLRAGCVARLAQELQPRKSEASSNGALRTATLFPEAFVEQVKENFSREGKRVSAVLPCTPLQEAMLSSTRNSSYSNQMVFKLHVPEAEMKEYWGYMHRRHGILRTCFISTRDVKCAVAQVVLDSWPMPWHVVEAGSLQEATDQHAQEVPDALDSNTPPVSLAVLQTEEGVYLSFACHHALYDGVAIDALLAEVEQLATGKNLDAPVDYMPVLLEVLNAPDGASEFWKRHFEGYRPTQHKLSAKLPSALCDESTKTTTKSLDIPLGQLQDFCKNLGVSPLSFFQTAWSVFLCIVYGETDICFGNVMSGRVLSADGIDRLVAPCFNTLPVRAEISSSTQLLALLKKFHTLNPQLLECQFTPLRSIQTQVSKSGKQLFDSLLLLQQPRAERLSSIWELVEDNGTMDVPLVCELTPHPSNNCMDVKIHSNSSSMTEDAVAGLLGVFFDVITRIMAHPASSILTREILTLDSLQTLDGLVVDVTFNRADQPDTEDPADEEDWSETEIQIRSIVAELSKVPVSKIGRSTSIFQLGLDSINAVQLAAMMREHGLELSALNVIEFPTCAKMASCFGTFSTQQIVQYDFAKFEQEVGVPAWPGSDKVLPCSPLQCAMLNDFIQSEGKDYLNYMSFVLGDDITLDQIRDAWEMLLKHHEILRTGFMPSQHRDASFAMVQYSSKECQLPISVRDNAADQFNVAKWKMDTAHNVLQSLHQPPWALALECGTSITMHIIMHHALYDAYSLQLILTDLSLCLSGKVMLDHPSIERAVSPILQASVNPGHSQGFWKKKASEVVVNRFPTLTPLTERSPELLSEIKVSGTTFSGLTGSARKVGIPIQAILEAAWTRVLSAYLGEDDVVFGVVLSGRMNEDAENAIFPCINTVPVIAHNKPSNLELLQQLHDYNSQLVKNQNAPLAQIQKWLGHPNTRVFDTLLVYQRMPEHNLLDFPWQTLSDEGNLDYPVSVEVEPLSCGKIQLRLTFRTDVLPRPQALQLLDQFDAVLQHLAQKPNESASDLWASHSPIFSILPPLEPIILSEEKFLHSFVETKAQACPKKLALEFVTGFDGETPVSRHWTFHELNERGNQVANVLAPYAQTGKTIAIHFDKCPEAIFSILGILKVGCAFLALDPSAPKARKEFILKDSAALALLTNTDIDFTVEQPHIHVDDALLHSAPKTFTSPESLTVQDNSYCLYTSGTTGTPKGCEITHENAVQAMKAFQGLFDGHWDEDSRWMQFASFHFDVSVLEQYWSWSVGMPLIAAPRDLILDDLAGAIRRLNITHLDLTPSLARLLDPSEVPSLSRGVFITGGEALKQEILDVWGPVGVIYNAYGPTEATIGVTMYQRVPQNGRASNIGKQFDNVGSFVLQPGTDIPVMKGAVGELCVSGKLVGKGYLNRPELTRERFPFLERLGERVYRTGDLVRLLHDGCFDFLGRADDQVKLRGQRLEIGEINHSIRTRVSEVSDVATLVTKHGSLDKDLLVTFVSCDSKAASKGELRVLNEEDTAPLVRSVQKACRDTLPGYMVPSYIFQVPFIPLSPNNKADTKQLNQLFRGLTPENLVQLSPSSRAVFEPVNDTQRQVLFTVREFLGGDIDVSLSSNIFDLGVDSISALRLSRLLRRNGLMGASPKVILRNPALGDLAEALQQNESSKEGSGVQEARQLIQAFGHRYRSLAIKELGVADDGDIEYVAPCTPLQEGMLSRFMSDQDEGAYFTGFRLKLASEVSIAKLKDACEKLVQSHAILRTSFIQTPAGFAQVAIKSTGLCWRDLRSQEPTQIETKLSDALHELIQKNSKNVCKPLELIIAQLGDQTILVVHIFHALYDGTSFEAMLRWVSAEYLHEDHETAPSFLDTLAHGPLANYDSSRQFWTEHLRSCSFDTIPRLRVGGATEVIAKTKTYSARNLETLRRSLNVTLQSVVLALWTSTFKKHFPVNAATGVIVSGRSIDMDQIENTIGPLFNTLLFYAGIKEGDTWLSLIQKCHEFNTSVLQFQHVPLRNIQKWCTKSRGRPIFENLFVFQVESPQSAEQSGMWSIMDDYSVSDYPLAFEASATPDGQLRVQIVAHRDLADEAALNCLFEEIDEAMVDVTSSGTHSLPVTENPSREASTAASPLTPLTSRPESVDGDAIKDHHLDLSPSDFDWTSAALALRKEIAALSGSSEDTITENMALLALGLDSIDLVKLSARLKHTGYELTLSQLMRSQTIAEMSKILNEKKPSSLNIDKQADFEELKSRLWRAVEMTKFNFQDVEAVLPPTPLQESMVADMLQSDFEQYFNHDILELADGLDIAKFEKAWYQVIERSPILRTVFVQIEDPKLEQTFCQVIHRSNSVRISKQETKGMSGVRSLIDMHKEKARDSQGSANLLQLSIASVNGKSLLVLSIAHALYDGWSLALLHQDVVSAYEEKLARRPPIEPFLQGLIKTPTDHSRKFWSQYLANTHPSLLSERDSSSRSSRNTTHRTEVISGITLDQVTAFCKHHAVSLQALGQACWASTLATLLQTLEVTFGVVLAGRDSEQAQSLMFPTMNTVAVRCFLHGSTTGFLHYLQETMGDITEFQNYPLRKAQSVAGGRLFNTLFILQKSPGSEPENPIMKSIQGSSATEFAVCAELEVTAKSLIWRVAGQDAFVSEKMTHQLLHQLDRALKCIVETPDDNVLHFEGDDVSICRLQPFQIQKTVHQASNTAADAFLDIKDGECTDTESVIRRVLSQVAGIELNTIEKSRTLYNLGLDSISTIKVSSLLRKEGLNIGVRALLTSSSIKEMARQTQVSAGIEKDVSRSPRTSRTTYQLPDSINISAILANAGIAEPEVEEILPPLPMQVYMMSSWQNAQGCVFYPDFFYRLRGSVEQSQLKSAWAVLVDAEPILRTCLVPTGERSTPFVQVVIRSGSEGPYRNIVFEKEVAPVEAERHWPQVQLGARLEDKNTWLLRLSLQHSLYDGFSLPSLLGKLLSILRGQSPTTEPNIDAWKSFIVSHNDEDTKEHNRAFWTKYLKDTQLTHLREHANVIDDASRVSLIKRSAIQEVSRLQSSCARAGVGLPALFFAATAKTLQKLQYGSSGLEPKEVVFGIYYANRSLAENLESTYPTLNLVPLRVSMQHDSDILQVARQIQEELHLISLNSTVGLWEVKDWTGVEIDCFVNFLHLDDDSTETLQHGDVALEPILEAHHVERLRQSFGTNGRSTDCSTRWLKDNAVRDAFPNALDIEASIIAGGVDIGVFGASEKVSKTTAHEMITILSSFLGEL